MAVPKTKTSKARRNSRHSANFKSTAPTLVECPKCHEMKVSHRACVKCGDYKGKTVVNTEKKETK